MDENYLWELTDVYAVDEFVGGVIELSFFFLFLMTINHVACAISNPVLGEMLRPLIINHSFIITRRHREFFVNNTTFRLFVIADKPRIH